MPHSDLHRSRVHLLAVRASGVPAPASRDLLATVDSSVAGLLIVLLVNPAWKL